MPGNPVSSLVSLLVIGRSVLHRLAGAPLDADLPPGIVLPAGAALGTPGNRINFLRGSLSGSGENLTVLPYSSQDSSLISSLTGSSGLIELAAGDTPIAAGTPVIFRAYDGLMR